MAKSLKQQLAAAIADYNAELSDENWNAVLDILQECLDENVKFLLAAEPEKENGKTVYYARTLHDENGRIAIAAFTSRKNVEQMPSAKVHPVELETIFRTAMESTEINGLVLDPNGKSFMLCKEDIAEIFDLAESILREGVTAYNAHDFKHAFECYLRSSAMGNVTALSNLGYCYYYGRSVPVDYQKAAECFEQAAKQGDVCATYKLGDLYGDGILGSDKKKAFSYYQKAYALATATDERDPYSFPDVCLRLARHFAELPKESENAFALIMGAVNGFHTRIALGDTFTDKVLAEALELEQRLLKQRKNAE